MQPPNLTKGPLLATKWAKNEVFVGGLRGVRFKRVHFLSGKGPLLGDSASSGFDPGYRPEGQG